MITSPIRQQFNSVLRSERLADIPSGFRDAEFFDEVPLYSRYQQVEFLKEHGDVNRLLVELALEYLQRIVSEVSLAKSKRLLAITIIRSSDEEPIVPSIFVCNSKVKTRLRRLHLTLPGHGLGERIRKIVAQIYDPADYSVLEDCLTVPGDVRVFVGYKSPRAGLVDIDSLARNVSLNHDLKRKLHPTLQNAKMISGPTQAGRRTLPLTVKNV